jgi:pathogenesis-related protein 1
VFNLRVGGRSEKGARVLVVRALALVLVLLLPVAPASSQMVSLLVANELLAAHNAARVKVGSPPLAWSDHLADAAQQWANHLMATHAFAEQPRDPHGENLFLIAGGTVSPAEVVRTWVTESRDYDRYTNNCNGVCGHYTQVIWRATRLVGCGAAFDGYRQIWVCEYEPPGNIKGASPY